MKPFVAIAVLALPLALYASEGDPAWRAVMEQAVAKQPGRVGARAFAGSLGLKAWSAQGKEFARAARQVKEWPVITVEGEALVFTEKNGRGARLELVNADEKDFRVNGKPFKVDTDRPLLNQLKETLAEPESTKASPSFSLIPSAHAAVPGSDALAASLFPVVSAVANGETYRKLASDPDLRRRAELRSKPQKFPKEQRLPDQGVDAEGLSKSAK